MNSFEVHALSVVGSAKAFKYAFTPKVSHAYFSCAVQSIKDLLTAVAHSRRSVTNFISLSLSCNFRIKVEDDVKHTPTGTANLYPSSFRNNTKTPNPISVGRKLFDVSVANPPHLAADLRPRACP